uniref:Uncharacterized protein n=1 Tax=Arundo donax TaxID=35708 RepID=A0A0A9A2S8_ARUDO
MYSSKNNTAQYYDFLTKLDIKAP